MLKVAQTGLQRLKVAQKRVAKLGVVNTGAKQVKTGLQSSEQLKVAKRGL